MRMLDPQPRLRFEQAVSRGCRLLLPVAALLVFAGALALAACGAYSSTGIPHVTPTAGSSTPGVTQTPGVRAYAYLFSRVDYPLQIPVNDSDTVTLTLSPNSNILTVTPVPGSGTASVGNPIPLPTDVRDYQDVGAAVDTVSSSQSATSPIVWQLISAPRQSLLTPATAGTARGYRSSVQFQWHVQAVAAGQNLIQITLHLYFVYLDGSEHDGSIDITQTPIPMVAVTPTPLNTTLPPLRLPVAGLTWLAGIIAAIRFIWGAIHTVHDIADPVKDIAHAAQAVQSRLSGGNESAAQSSRNPHAQYPNPWMQRAHQPPSLNQPSSPESSSPPSSNQRLWPPAQ